MTIIRTTTIFRTIVWGAVLMVSTQIATPSTSAQTGQSPPAAAADDGFVSLFDGKSLDQWRGYKNEAVGAGWKIDGDSLHFDGSGGGDIITKQEFSDFELVFEWRVTAKGNSGVMYRVSMGDPAPYLSGPEYQILDNDGHPDGQRPITSAASLYAMVVPEGAQPKPIGEWNEGKIRLVNNQLEHWLNGKKVVSIEVNSDDWKKRKEASKFKDWDKFGANAKGHICLQDHGDPIWFRNLKIREIK